MHVGPRDKMGEELDNMRSIACETVSPAGEAESDDAIINHQSALGLSNPSPDVLGEGDPSLFGAQKPTTDGGQKKVSSMRFTR